MKSPALGPAISLILFLFRLSVWTAVVSQSPPSLELNSSGSPNATVTPLTLFLIYFGFEFASLKGFCLLIELFPFVKVTARPCPSRKKCFYFCLTLTKPFRLMISFWTQRSFTFEFPRVSLLQMDSGIDRYCSLKWSAKYRLV